jgi:threonine/homoserine/homoserine lactone efflux protein
MSQIPGLWIFMLPAVTFGFAAAVQPGPLSIYLISQTLRNGWRRTMPAIFTPIITDGPVAVICLFILSKLPVNFLQYLQILGGGFILYLAYRALQTWKNEREKSVDADITARKTLFNAMVINILNPNAYLGWSLVIGPLFLKGWKASPAFGISVLTGFYGTMFITTAIIIMLFHLAKERGPGLQRPLTGISAIVLGLFGVYMLVMGGIGIFG